MPRNLVLRPDGKLVNVARKRGQLFVCASGCCCGHTERNFALVPTELYHNEWERRKLRNKVHLTIGGCLGPCPLANVTLLLFDDRHIWFHSMNSATLIVALYDYIEAMLAADAYLPPPPLLAEYTFTSFTWDGHEVEGQADRQERRQPARREPVASAVPAILFLSHSDTDLLALEAALPNLPADFSEVRHANPAHLRSDADIDAFLDAALLGVELVIVRLLGGRASFAHGVGRLIAWARENETWLVLLPGTEALDPELTAASTVGVPVAHEALAYLLLGGASNVEQCLRFLSDHLLTTGFGFDSPVPEPRHGAYYPGAGRMSIADLRARHDPARPTVGILFYRAHYLAGNTAFVDALVREVEAQGANALPVFAYSLKDMDEEEKAESSVIESCECCDGGPSESPRSASSRLPVALRYFVDDSGQPAVDALLTTMSFALGGVDPSATANASDWEAGSFAQLGVPILQVIAATSSRAQWQNSSRGLTPIDTAMNVALPEFDGRIITVPVSFKAATAPARPASVPGTTGTAMRYDADTERVRRIVGMALRLATLRRKPNAEKRLAIILTNSPAKAARIGNAVGLDAPASLVRLLHGLRDAGYDVGDIPASGDELIHALIDRCSYDTELLTEDQLAMAAARVPEREYARWFGALPPRNQREIADRWGPPPGEAYVHEHAITLAGLRLGNVFLALQPPRGYGMDPNAIYHVPDLPPTHNYHALYRWLRDPAGWGADAMIHLGKHGTLEWLPGKSIGLSEECYPDQLLADIPLVYPFIINNPGEGAQAKRRAHAVVVDHLIPPMTSAGAYGELAELAQLVDEYYQVEALDPTKLPVLQRQIWGLLQRAHLDDDLKVMARQNHGDHTHEWDETLNEDGTPATLSEMRGKDFAHLLEDIDGYLCELTGVQIRDGLHVLGTLPEGEQLTDLLFSLTRLPNLEIPSLRAVVASAYGLDLGTLLDAPGRRLSPEEQARLAAVTGNPERADAPASAADGLQAIEERCRELLAALQSAGFAAERVEEVAAPLLAGASAPLASVFVVLRFVCEQVVPRLSRTGDEVERILQGLAGAYIPPGPSGSPTRGMVHVLPTGRNFYSIDPRALPSPSAWEVGERLADELIERHLRETGRYPESIGLSIWGTSAMRTQGDDIAQAFALLGVRPRWQPENRRLLGIEVIPLERLGRPRIDVVCRISGFFRDAFPHLISVLDEAVETVATLDEPAERNYLRRHVQAETERRVMAGEHPERAAVAARYRLFGAKPGAYGAGILPLIDEHNWQDTSDFAEAYVNWGGYAYTAREFGVDARGAFRTALAGIEVAAKNQDNREHDIFDSDDYLQFHGGMIAAIRALSGKQPRRYVGDTSDPERVRVRDLKEEALRVFRARVTNPKWIEAMRRHGYKGGLELTATVDYLFGYDATSGIMEDWMYERVAHDYAFDPATRTFLRASNPWALQDIATRLFEAAERKLWRNPDAATLAALRGVLLEAEGDIEGRSEA